MKKVDFTEISGKIIRQLGKNGAFLTVKDMDGRLNTMAIGWASIGIMWRKPVFTVMVRYSRETYKLIGNAEDFTVSFPTKNQLAKELAYCGVKSARDVDKFKELNLKTADSKTVKTPVIADCDVHIECKIICKQALDPAGFGEYITDVYREQKDYHVLYYGEILSCYES